MIEMSLIMHRCLLYYGTPSQIVILSLFYVNPHVFLLFVLQVGNKIPTVDLSIDPSTRAVQRMQS